MLCSQLQIGTGIDNVRSENFARIYSCGFEGEPQVGETVSVLLYLQFFSDGSGTGKGFSLTYNAYKGNSHLTHVHVRVIHA